MRRYLPVLVILALLAPSVARSAPNYSNVLAFAGRWARDDGAIATGIQRGWTWGPLVLRSGSETYFEGRHGRREVWYFDKGRMEITEPAADPGDPWYVSSGLLVRELISGQLQIGHNLWEAWDAAPLPVAGDLAAPLDQTISYADLRAHASIGNMARTPARSPEQGPFIDLITPGGAIAPDGYFAQYNVLPGAYDDVLGHNTAAVFVEALTPETLLYLAGRPLTEPFWARVPVSGVLRDVLLQAFERRVLTYTPSNPTAWQVEWGNVGQQYAAWRYGQAEDGASFDPNVALEANTTIQHLRVLSPAAAEIATNRRGFVGVAVYDLDSGAFYSFQGTRLFRMYSVAKVPIMLAVLDRAVRENRRVTPYEQQLIAAMIQVSDNYAATELIIDVGGGAVVEQYLRRIGITNTKIDTYSWGSSTTTAQDMARMMAKLGDCTILVKRLCDYGLSVMQGVVGSQRWGVSAGVPASATIALKNGWFPERAGWGINSIGLITAPKKRYSIAVLTYPDPSMNYGIETIQQISTELYPVMP